MTHKTGATPESCSLVGLPFRIFHSQNDIHVGISSPFFGAGLHPDDTHAL